MGVALKPGAHAQVEQPLEQILVEVASNQMRILTTDVGQVSMRTVIGHGLAGPKRQGIPKQV